MSGMESLVHREQLSDHAPKTKKCRCSAAPYIDRNPCGREEHDIAGCFEIPKGETPRTKWLPSPPKKIKFSESSKLTPKRERHYSKMMEPHWNNNPVTASSFQQMMAQDLWHAQHLLRSIMWDHALSIAKHLEVPENNHRALCRIFGSKPKLVKSVLANGISEAIRTS